jgi:threonine dehydratase
MSSESLDQLAGCSLYFKCENFQKVGAFKARGAMNAVLSLTEKEREHGVATHSSGNHAQAVARAAKIVGLKSYIVMPHSAASVKRKGVLSYGGAIFDCEPTQESREATLAEVVQKTKAAVIHPFDDYNVITGQATTAKEFIEDVPSLEIMIAPVGGGGLLSGTCLSMKYFSPGTIVIAGEPEGADDAFRSMQSGKREKSQGKSIADGLLTSIGEKTFEIIKDKISKVITVSDEEIIKAMGLIWEKLKIVIEPSAAVPFAAILKVKETFDGKKVGVILSGGNVDLKKVGEFF